MLIKNLILGNLEFKKFGIESKNEIMGVQVRYFDHTCYLVVYL